MLYDSNWPTAVCGPLVFGLPILPSWGKKTCQGHVMRNPTPPSSGCAAAQQAARTTLGTVRKATRPTRATLAAGVLSMKRTPVPAVRGCRDLWQLLAYAGLKKGMGIRRIAMRKRAKVIRWKWVGHGGTMHRWSKTGENADRPTQNPVEWCYYQWLKPNLPKVGSRSFHTGIGSAQLGDLVGEVLTFVIPSDSWWSLLCRKCKPGRWLQAFALASAVSSAWVAGST